MVESISLLYVNGKHAVIKVSVPLGAQMAKGWQGPQGQRTFAPTGRSAGAFMQDQGLIKIVFSVTLQKRKVIKSEEI